MLDVELYDRRFDWLAASLLAVPLVWLFYGGDAALVSALAFALVGALKPLNRWIGPRLAAGVFAAGVVLLFSPLLRFVFYDGYCYGGTWSPAEGISRFQDPDICGHGLFSHFDQDVWIGVLRDLVMPIAGLGLVLLAWPRSVPVTFSEEPNDSSVTRAIGPSLSRWGVLILALTLWIAGGWYNYHAEQVAMEKQQAAEQARQQAEAIAAAEAAKKKAEDEANRKMAEAAAMAARNVDANWLIGAWALVQGYDGQPPDPALYCATDTGYTFKKGGRYVGASHEGTFALKNNVITLSNRSNFEIGDPDFRSEHLPPIDLKVERRGEKLIMDGDAYGRC